MLSGLLSASTAGVNVVGTRCSETRLVWLWCGNGAASKRMRAPADVWRGSAESLRVMGLLVTEAVSYKVMMKK